MIKAACHCGAVRFAVAGAPRWVLDCSCTICRRYGALWTYCAFTDNPMELVARPDPAATATYTWQDHEIGFHHCRTCGCITHFEALDQNPPMILGLNARMMVGLDGPGTRIRQIDNGHVGWFWTRVDGEVIPGRHPPMPPAGPDDWR
jgi:hypothetical protein